MNRLRLVHRDTLSCEPIVRRMLSGELLLVSQCGDVTEPAPGNRVFAFHSQDNGDTWSKGHSVYPEDGQAVYLTEVMVLGEEITVFLTLHNGNFLNWTCVMVKSRDNGYTWENAGPTPCFPRFTFVRSMIRLRTGEIALPYQHYPVSQAENDRLVTEGKRWLNAEIDHVESGVMVSADEGKTYEKRPGVRTAFDTEMGRAWIWSEPTVAELSDGRIAMLLRVNPTARLWYAESPDGGRTWTDAVMTDIPNPSNKPKLIPLPGGNIALIHTPNPRLGMDHRNPLSIWISPDDMRTWPYRHIVTDFPGSYSYADGFYEDGHILFSIEYNRHDILFIDHPVPEAYR